jgi:type IV secretion system protein VirB5
MSTGRQMFRCFLFIALGLICLTHPTFRAQPYYEWIGAAGLIFILLGFRAGSRARKIARCNRAFWRSLAAAASIFAAMPAHAQWLTFDASNAVGQVKQLMETIEVKTQGLRSYMTQLRQLSTEVQQLAAQVQMVEGFVHDPSLGTAMGLMNMTGLGNSLPVSPYAVMGVVNGFSGGYSNVHSFGGALSKLSSLGNMASSFGSTNRIYRRNDGTWIGDQMDSGADSIAGTQGMGMSLLDDLQKHIPILEALRLRAQSAKDMKDVADVQAAIQAEQVWTANTMGQLQAVQLAADMQVRNREQRDNEMLAKSQDAFLEKVRAYTGGQ